MASGTTGRSGLSVVSVAAAASDFKLVSAATETESNAADQSPTLHRATLKHVRLKKCWVI